MRRLATIALFFCCTLLSASCQEDEPTSVFPSREPAASPTSSTSTVIALVGTMSGPESWRGEDAFEGADLAVHILNRDAGGTFELVTLDDRGDPTRATELIEEQASSPRVAGIVFAGPIDAVPESEDALAESGIPLIICYGDLYGARLLTSHVFQASPSVLVEARRIASYLLQDRRYKRIGMLSTDDLSGQAARHSFSTAVADEGGRLVGSETIQADAESLASELSALRSKRVQAIFIAAPPRAVESVLRELDQMSSRYTTTRAAGAIVTTNGRSQWRPQIATTDLAIAPLIDVSLQPGMIAADSYVRGAHYLPIPALVEFRKAFEAWWGERPLGWEQRAYEAVRLVGWAVNQASEGDDLAVVLEGLKGERFGGLDVSFSSGDHMAVDPRMVGLWVIPRTGIEVRERDRIPDSMPWVPLGRGFATNGKRTDISPKDWRYLFRHSPSENRPAPRFDTSRFGVTTSRKDPVH